MTYEIYRYIFIGAAILSALMLFVAVLLFILLKIPRVIGDLSGRTARKAIENIRNQNEASGDKTYRSSAVNRERGKITDRISPTGSLLKTPTDPLVAGMATEKIGTRKLSSEDTEVLDSGATTVLDSNSNETTVLSAEIGGNETTVLFAQPSEAAFPDEALQTGTVFEIEYEITYIHTDEAVPAEVV